MKRTEKKKLVVFMFTLLHFSKWTFYFSVLSGMPFTGTVLLNIFYFKIIASVEIKWHTVLN